MGPHEDHWVHEFDLTLDSEEVNVNLKRKNWGGGE